jgi:hypothetical protein
MIHQQSAIGFGRSIQSENGVGHAGQLQCEIKSIAQECFHYVCCMVAQFTLQQESPNSG